MPCPHAGGAISGRKTVRSLVPIGPEHEDWGSRGLAYTASEMQAQNPAAGLERAARPHIESHLETLAGMLSSEGGVGAAETRAHILDVTGALRGISDGGGEARQSAAGASDRAAAQQAQQPGLRALEHRSTAFLQDLRQTSHSAARPTTLLTFDLLCMVPWCLLLCAIMLSLLHLRHVRKTAAISSAAC